ncbi:MAG: hypothetical protein ACTSXL_01760 [Alphaproteobacteria bacterium]|nr:MAG: hypothetical protein B6I23_02215 [Rickettsiaceae bacterium 4572_127]
MKRIYIIAGTFILLIAYIGFYYKITHGFTANMNANFKIAPCVASKFKNKKDLQKYFEKRMSETNCQIDDNICREKVGYFVNPYNRKKALIFCHEILSNLLFTNSLNNPNYKCKEKK